jgi:hypothetical protein
MWDVRFSSGVILLHTALKFAKQLPAFVARVAIADVRTGEYDDTVVIPERTQSKENSQGLRLARALRTDGNKFLVREVGVDVSMSGGDGPLRFSGGAGILRNCK